MNWNELKRKAVKHGFVFRKHGGKHDEYYNPKTNVVIQIERHWNQEVRKGLAEKLRKEIGF
ncbi:MAG: type II toxin-antitoxin system HicA family toxin [Bacteroidales bacterium]|nr:type II toxin-antitoxin system HicA family toxin [Bacteroidales bacterium]MCM1148151.1 type II toxin-antitoxin system HicA family toxin [Bacteroidales bacterium]MCM1207122.1 type II toxin-antitoxin system HicA family toxin [Bacillota bacterium]MCM1510874.1 type II toxin-antitoxin system HicA family toxin [Clostridium sp.]